MSTNTKLTKKEKHAISRSQSGTKKPEAIINNQKSLRTILAIITAIAGMLVYINTANHEFVLDDFGLIRDNTQTKKGIAAIPEIFSTSYRTGMNVVDNTTYRPLSKAMFAVEWQISPKNPALGHWMNIIWFGITCFVLFKVLSKLFKNNLVIPFIATMIFATHPLHTEVVANIKSRDEIIAFLCCLGAISFLFNYTKNNSTKSLLAGTFLYFVGIFSKESTVTFLAIIPLVFYFFTDAKKSHYINSIGLMLLFTLIFLGIRRSILGSYDIPIPIADNSLVAIDGFLNQRINAIAILGIYLKLLVFPDKLMADASYNQIPAVGFTSPNFLIPFAILIGATIYAIIRFKKKDPISFGILFFLITMSIGSNVIILIGTNYAERLTYVPLLGFAIVTAALLSKLIKKADNENDQKPIEPFVKMDSFIKYAPIPLTITLIISLAFGARAVVRNKCWKSDTTLYDQGIIDAPNSCHMNFYLANHISADEAYDNVKDSAELKRNEIRSIQLLDRAIEIFPQYADAYQRRGYIYNKRKELDKAIADFKKALEYNPTHPIVYNNLGTVYFNTQRYDLAMDAFTKAARNSPNYAHAWNNLGSANGVYGESERNNAKTDMANADQHLKNANDYFSKAIGYFLKAHEIDPEFIDPVKFLAMTYRNMGNESEAIRWEALQRKMEAEKQKKDNAKN